jgi:FemAB-related protein (PEP-CTERM system-associated)
MKSVEVHLLARKDEQKWDEFVNKSENATFFHQSAWKHVVEKTYHHKSVYLFTEDENGQITGILPLFFIDNLLFGKKLISLPFAPYGGICANHGSAAISLLTEAIRHLESLSANFCELRCFYEHPCPNFRCTEEYSTFIMDLRPDKQILWNKIGKKNRNMVRKSVKLGLTYKLGEGSTALAEFYRVYTDSISALGTPAHSFDFFQEVHDQFPASISIAIVSFREDPIATLFLMHFRDQVISGWGGSLPFSLSYAPNNFLYWQSLLTEQQKGCSFFDFGRSLEGTGNYHFKRHWGATERHLRYCYYPCDLNIRPPQESYGLGAKVWKFIPASINRLVGPMIRKYVV